MSEAPKGNVCYVYIVRCQYGTYYTGWTNDIMNRLAAHNSGKGAKYLRGRGPVTLVYKKKCLTARRARSQEALIKGLTRQQKEALISSHNRRNA